MGIGNIQRAVSDDEEFIIYKNFYDYNKNKFDLNSKLEYYRKI